MTCALAMHRGYAVATDDREVRPILAARAPWVRVRTTSEVIRRWADAERIDISVLKQILIDVQEVSVQPMRPEPRGRE